MLQATALPRQQRKATQTLSQLYKQSRASKGNQMPNRRGKAVWVQSKAITPKEHSLYLETFPCEAKQRWLHSHL